MSGFVEEGELRVCGDFLVHDLLRVDSGGEAESVVIVKDAGCYGCQRLLGVWRADRIG